MGPVDVAVHGGRARVVLYESANRLAGRRIRAVRGTPSVPGPGLVTGLMSVEPVEQSVPPGRVAGALARFRDRHGYLRDGRRRVDVPAADAAAGVEVVDVPGGHEVVQGIGGLVRHPARAAVCVADPAQ